MKQNVIRAIFVEALFDEATITTGDAPMYAANARGNARWIAGSP